MRTALLVVAAIVCAASLAHADEEGADDGPLRASVRVEPEPTTCYVGQRVQVNLIVDYDAVYFAEHGVQLYRRELDVPLRVIAPWFDQLLAAPTGGVARALSFALNDDVVRALPTADVDADAPEPPFARLRIVRTLLPQEPGEIVFPAPRLRFGHAERFEDDFVNGRVAVDPRDRFVTGTGATLIVRALPTEGRPAEFSGAIGQFTLAIRASTESVRVGETFQITFEVRGEGNLASFDTPRLDHVAALHVLGTADDRATPLRSIVFDVTPRVVGALPALGLAYFDPNQAVSAVAQSAPLTVRIAAGASVASPTAKEPELSAEDDGNALLWIVGIIVGAIAAFVMLLRRRGASASDPLRERRRAARAAFDAQAASAPAEAFTQYLATCLDCPAAAVISPELPERLRTAGVPEPTAERTARLVERLVGARYGGTEASPADRRELIELADAVAGALNRTTPSTS